jgi:stage V sporulation protein D (sporulation-specific penicillin-binding protein)
MLGVDHDRLLGSLASGRQFAYVARRQAKDKADQVRAAGLPGVGLEPEQQRSYLPGGSDGASLAGNLLGFVNYDGQGQYGVEGFYDQRLAGKAGYKTTYRDAAGRDIALGPSQRVNPVNGPDMVLSLDAGIQYAAEQALAAGVKANKAESGSVIIMDPHTGGIIAWADYPTYNANTYTTSDPASIKDRIAADLYEPGSVMKVVTLAGAMDAGAITPATTINDPGYIDVGGARLRDWDLKNHGTVTMTRVLEESYNVGAVRAQQAEGAAAYYRYLQGFGFDAPAGVDVAGEQAATPLRPLDQWRPSELATAAFGQGIAVNMVQMCAALNVIANNGKYAQPHVVERIGGQPNPMLAAPQRQVISAESAAQMNRMMQSVVTNGSGYTSRIQGFEKDAAGKTGTSQIPENGQYSTDHVWASYAGFLPADNPRFTMLVVIRKPNNGSFDHNEGYYVSAPIWKQIAQAMILQWRITPDPR